MRSPKSWAASTTGRRPSSTRSFHISVNETDIEPTRFRELIDQAEVEADKISKPSPESWRCTRFAIRPEGAAGSAATPFRISASG